MRFLTRIFVLDTLNFVLLFLFLKKKFCGMYVQNEFMKHIFVKGAYKLYSQLSFLYN